MFDPVSDTAFAHRVLDAIAMRMRVAMHNLTNKNTDGYKRYVVHFEDELRNALENGSDFKAVHPRITRDESGGPGVNNVSEFDEMAIMEKTRALHEIYSKRVGGYFRSVNRAIHGR